MSDIKKRLDLLKKIAKKPEPTKNIGDSAGLITPDTVESSSDPEKKAKLDHLRNLMDGVKHRAPAPPDPLAPGPLPNGSVNDVVAALNRRPLMRGALVRDHAPAPGAGLLEADLFEGPGQSIEDLIPGEYIETPNGPCFRVRTEYPWFYHQGDMAVSTLLDLDPAPLAKLAGSPEFAMMDYRKTLFFDTETTGLDTGAGVYIFLAGLGFFEERTFVVEQYFMRDFPEEPAVLNALTERMALFEYLVTYNGKTYDWPLLESRFAMNRRPMPMQNPRHLDLLHGSRRLFKHRLENCRLASVEAGVLGFHRVDDLPGALMPELYFRYVRSRDARFIHEAFAHNAHDIVSMAAVLAAVIQLLDRPLESGCYPPEDVYAVARLLENNGDDAGAVASYTEALKRGLPVELYADALHQLSLAHRRLGDWEKACNIWRTMIQTAPKAGIFPYVELAKYFEHQMRDYEEAGRWVEAAMQFLPSCTRAHPESHRELIYRSKRIEAKRRGEPWKSEPKESSSLE